MLLRESRADLAHRHFDVAGAASITAGLMLLVYALTRATTDGWGAPLTVGLLVASAALVAAFVVIELRSPAPLLPLRIFRLAHARGRERDDGDRRRGHVLGVLRADAVRAGRPALLGRCRAASRSSAFALTVVVVSNVAQWVVGRVGVRATLTAGLLASAASVALLTRLPLHGDYFWDLFPAFVLGGAGMALSFVPITIASLRASQPRRRGHRLRAS